MRPAISCLRRSTPELRNLTYPADAWAHYDELLRALAPWLQSTPGFRQHGAAGYGGPWLENVWISHFQTRAAAARAAGEPLSAVFGPYVPIFVPFTDQWVHGGPYQVGLKKYRYPAGLVPALLGVLRPSVAYITVSQSDNGLSGNGELPMHRIPNVLVLSAGGYGHVPVPLLKQPEAKEGDAPISPQDMLPDGLTEEEAAQMRAEAHLRAGRLPSLSPDEEDGESPRAKKGSVSLGTEYVWNQLEARIAPDGVQVCGPPPLPPPLLTAPRP